MCRTGSNTSPVGLRRVGAGIARVLVFLATLAMVAALSAPSQVHAAAATGSIETVICSGEGVVTIWLDRDGNPVEEPSDMVCDCGCAGCPAPDTPFPEPDGAAAARATVAARAAFPMKPRHLVSERGRLPVPRGPPTEKEA